MHLKVQLPLPDIQRNDITLTSARDGQQQTVLELTAMLARPGAQCQGYLENIGNGMTIMELHSQDVQMTLLSSTLPSKG